MHIFIRLSSLGDLVLCTALTNCIRESYPEDELLFLTQAEFLPFVAASFPAEIPVKSVSANGWGALGYFLTGLKLGQELFIENNITSLKVYDLHGVLKSKALILGLRLKAWLKRRKISVLKSPKKSFLRILSVVFAKDLLGPRHVYKSHLSLADFARSVDYVPKLRIGNPRFRESRRILVAPDAKHWKKRWITSYWEKLLLDLLKDPRGFELTLVGSTNALPQDLIDDIVLVGQERVLNLLGRTELKDLADIAATHAITLCGNSAWLHISEAVGTPVVSLAGPIVEGFGFSPWRKDSEELSVELSCKPCTRHGGGTCKRTGDDFHACMKDITPQQVFASVERVLRRRER